MDDLIRRQDAIELAMQYCPDDDGSCSKAGADIREMLDKLEDLPPAQPERKKGKWIRISDEPFADRFECSECGKLPPIENYEWRLSDYCPNCGADMRGEEE